MDICYKSSIRKRMVVDEIDNEMGCSEVTHLNCFVKSSSTSSSSQLSCQSGSALPPDALFSESNTLPDCSATRQLDLSTTPISSGAKSQNGIPAAGKSLSSASPRTGRKWNIPQTHHHPPKRPTGVISSSPTLPSFPLMVLLLHLLPSHLIGIGVCWILTWWS